MSQHSQQACLQDMLTWDMEQCKQNLQPLLSCLLEKLENESPSNDVFDAVSSKVLALMPQEELDEKILAKLSAQLQHKFDECLEQLSIATAAQDVILSALQECELTLKYAEQCISSLQQSSAALSQQIHYSNVQSFPPLVLHMLEGSVGFCKESEQIYTAKMFAILSKQLSSLFSQTARLYKLFLELILHMAIDISSALPEVLSRIHHICHLVASLDVKLSVSSLKVIARLSSEHRHMLEEDQTGTMGNIISALCADTVETMEYIANMQSSEANCGSHVKVAGFKLKVIASLVDSFTRQTPIEAVVSMLGMYHRYLSDEFPASVQKILTLLVSKQEFCTEVLAGTKTLSEHPKAGLQLLMDVMTAVSASEDSVLDMWMTDEAHSLFREALLMAQRGGRSFLTLPSSDTTISAYERCCCLLSTLAARVSPQHFQHVESTLLEVTVGSSAVASLLAADVWAFLARYSTVDVCMEQCVALCQLLRSAPALCPAPAVGRLLALLHRLAKFLPPDKQEELVSMFPLSEPQHLPLWSALPLSSQHVASVTARCKQQIETIVRQGYLTPTDNSTLSMLLPVCESDSTMISLAVGMLCGSLPSSLTSALLTMLASCELTKQQHDKVLRMPCSEPVVCVAMLRYLRSQMPNTPSVCDVLNTLLLSPVPAISLEARAVFADFASLTEHEAIVTQCVQADRKVHDIVVEYFNQFAGTQPIPSVSDDLQPPEDEVVLDFSAPAAKWYDANNKKTSHSGPPPPVSVDVLDAVLDIQQGLSVLSNITNLPRQATGTLQTLKGSMTGIVEKL